MDEILLTAEELATLLRTNKARIYNIIYKGGEGIDIPKSIQSGRRRLWPKSTVIDWIEFQLNSHKDEKIKVKTVMRKPTINRI